MDSKKVVVRKTKKYGRAVFAKQRITKGTVIAVFDGPVMDDDFEPWTNDLYNHAIQVGKTLWRDSLGIARFINHSCEPNCGVKNFNQIVAMRTIPAGEEITWDYEMTEDNPTWRMRCRCGASICRRIIGSYKNMPDDIRKKYGNYISLWLRRAFKRR